MEVRTFWQLFTSPLCVPVCVRMCVPVCGNLPCPLFAWFSFFANRKEAFLTCNTLLPPMNRLCNRHFFLKKVQLQLALFGE